MLPDLFLRIPSLTIFSDLQRGQFPIAICLIVTWLSTFFLSSRLNLTARTCLHSTPRYRWSLHEQPAPNSLNMTSYSPLPDWDLTKYLCESILVIAFSSLRIRVARSSREFTYGVIMYY